MAKSMCIYTEAIVFFGWEVLRGGTTQLYSGVEMEVEQIHFPSVEKTCFSF